MATENGPSFGSGRASRGGGSPGLHGAQRRKAGDTAARAKPLP